MKKIKVKQKSIERTIYMLIIIALVVYGFQDSEGATSLIRVVKDAFSIIIITP